MNEQDKFFNVFFYASQMNQHGKGLLILASVSMAFDVQADFQNIPEGVRAGVWNKAIKALSRLSKAEQLAFARTLIDDAGSTMIKQQQN